MENLKFKTQNGAVVELPEKDMKAISSQYLAQRIRERAEARFPDWKKSSIDRLVKGLVADYEGNKFYDDLDKYLSWLSEEDYEENLEPSEILLHKAIQVRTAPRAGKKSKLTN